MLAPLVFGAVTQYTVLMYDIQWLHFQNCVASGRSLDHFAMHTDIANAGPFNLLYCAQFLTASVC